jgi:uncharacterized protein
LSSKKNYYVDMHVHVPTKEYLEIAGGEFHRAAERMFGTKAEAVRPEELIKEYDESGIEKMMILGWDAETGSKLPRVPNEIVASYVSNYPERMTGFGSVDPLKETSLVLKELEHCAKDLGLKGLKLHPIAQAFRPNENKFYPIYEKCVQLNFPIIFHTGTTGWGRALPGGGGAKLDYANPIYLDQVAADFPKLTIIMAHPAFPWIDEQLAIATHKQNAFIDLSGWSPKYFDPAVLQYMTKIIPNKFMFGTDYPFLHPAKWLAAFNDLGVDESIKIKVLGENARQVFNL